MTFAAISYLNISINLLLIVFVIVCVFMTLIILMQRPKQEGLGAAFGAGVTDQVFGARTTNVLQRATVYLGSAFFILSLVLAILVGKQNQQKSLIGRPLSAKVEAKPAETPAAPKSLAEELPAETAPIPVTPATPDAQVTPVPVPVPAEPTPAVPTPSEPVEPAPGSSTEKPEGQ